MVYLVLFFWVKPMKKSGLRYLHDIRKVVFAEIDLGKYRIQTDVTEWRHDSLFSVAFLAVTNRNMALRH